jgi:Fe-S cluster assembly iron-binding protein IscA
MSKLIFAIDFDGTIVTNDFPKMGDLMPNAKEVINTLYDSGHTILVWTCRSFDKNTEANIYDVANFLGKSQLKVHGINVNAESVEFNPFPKIYADIYIDDRQLGGIPGDWLEILEMINKELKNRNMEEVKVMEQVGEEVIPVFEYVKVVAEEGYEWLQKGSRLYFDEESEAYIYEYDVKLTDETDGSSFEQSQTYVLSIKYANDGVLQGIFEYGGDLITDTEFLANGE